MLSGSRVQSLLKSLQGSSACKLPKSRRGTILTIQSLTSGRCRLGVRRPCLLETNGALAGQSGILGLVNPGRGTEDVVLCFPQEQMSEVFAERQHMMHFGKSHRLSTG